MPLDMLTADHHHSSPAHRSPSPANGSILQMPLSLLGSVLRKQHASPAPAPAAVPPDAADTSAQPDTSLTSNVSPSPSRPASSSSQASADGKPKKRAPRPKTTYKLAQPPPSSHPRQKLHIRPKVLLQLHQVVASRRPKPVYEVIPYSILAPVSTRRLARTFRSRDKLGAHDLLIVKAEEYGSNEEDKTDDERWGARDVIGIICPGKEDKGNVIKTEVLLESGASWEVTNTPNGGYDFSCTDEHGLTLKARWVPKPAHTRRQSTMSSSSQASPITSPDDRKFTFSTISANSRRHPIIATMTRDRIEVLDSYNMPTATSPPTPGLPPSALNTPLATPSSFDMGSFADAAAERLPVTTDDALRRFIVVSGIWVAFCENWSPAYSFSKAACPSPLSTSATFRTIQPSRTVSMPSVESPRSASPASTIDENKRSFPRMIRTGTQLLHRNASFTGADSPVSSPTAKTRSRRSNSTGNAELAGRTGSTKKRFGLALEDQALPETEEERQNKRSTEILRLKESLPSPASIASASQNLTLPQSPHPQGADRSPSPSSLDPRAKKTRSAYNPVTTAGLWDSGVVDGRGLKTRPTSLVVVNEKKKKAKRKEDRSKSREKKEKEPRRKSEGFRQLFTGIFRRDKSAAT